MFNYFEISCRDEASRLESKVVLLICVQMTVQVQYLSLLNCFSIIFDTRNFLNFSCSLLGTLSKFLFLIFRDFFNISRRFTLITALEQVDLLVIYSFRVALA